MQYQLDVICRGCWQKIGEFHTDTAFIPLSDEEDIYYRARERVLEHRKNCEVYSGTREQEVVMYCPKCQNPMVCDKSWYPAEGYDPNLKRYICPSCHQEMYISKPAHYPTPSDPRPPQ